MDIGVQPVLAPHAENFPPNNNQRPPSCRVAPLTSCPLFLARQLINDHSFEAYLCHAEDYASKLSHSRVISETDVMVHVLVAYRKDDLEDMKFHLCTNFFSSQSKEILRELYLKCYNRVALKNGAEPVAEENIRMPLPIATCSVNSKEMCDQAMDQLYWKKCRDATYKTNYKGLFDLTQKKSHEIFDYVISRQTSEKQNEWKTRNRTFTLSIVNGKITILPNQRSCSNQNNLLDLCQRLLDDNNYKTAMTEAENNVKNVEDGDQKVMLEILVAYRKNNMARLKVLIEKNLFPLANHEILRMLYSKCLQRIINHEVLPVDHDQIQYPSSIAKYEAQWNKIEKEKAALSTKTGKALEKTSGASSQERNNDSSRSGSESSVPDYSSNLEHTTENEKSPRMSAPSELSANRKRKLCNQVPDHLKQTSNFKTSAPGKEIGRLDCVEESVKHGTKKVRDQQGAGIGKMNNENTKMARIGRSSRKSEQIRTPECEPWNEMEVSARPPVQKEVRTRKSTNAQKKKNASGENERLQNEPPLNKQFSNNASSRSTSSEENELLQKEKVVTGILEEYKKTIEQDRQEAHKKTVKTRHLPTRHKQGPDQMVEPAAKRQKVAPPEKPHLTAETKKMQQVEQTEQAVVPHHLLLLQEKSALSFSHVKVDQQNMINVKHQNAPRVGEEQILRQLEPVLKQDAVRVQLEKGQKIKQVGEQAVENRAEEPIVEVKMEVVEDEAPVVPHQNINQEVSTDSRGQDEQAIVPENPPFEQDEPALDFPQIEGDEETELDVKPEIVPQEPIVEVKTEVVEDGVSDEPLQNISHGAEESVENEQELQRFDLVIHHNIAPIVGVQPEMVENEVSDEPLQNTNQEAQESVENQQVPQQLEPVQHHGTAPMIEDQPEGSNEKEPSAASSDLPPRCGENFKIWNRDEMAEWVLAVSNSEIIRNSCVEQEIDGASMKHLLNNETRQELKITWFPWMKLKEAAEKMIAHLPK